MDDEVWGNFIFDSFFLLNVLKCIKLIIDAKKLFIRDYNYGFLITPIEFWRLINFNVVLIGPIP